MGSPYTNIYIVEQNLYDNFIEKVDLIKDNPSKLNWENLLKSMHFSSLDNGFSLLTESENFDINNPDWSSRENLAHLTYCLTQNLKSYHFEPDLVHETWHRELNLIPVLGKIVFDKKQTYLKSRFNKKIEKLTGELSDLEKSLSENFDQFNKTCDLTALDQYDQAKKSLHEKIISGLRLEVLLRISIKNNLTTLKDLYSTPGFPENNELFERYEQVIRDFKDSTNRLDESLSASANLKQRLNKISLELHNLVTQRQSIIEKIALTKKSIREVEDTKESESDYNNSTINSFEIEETIEEEKALYALRKLLLCHYINRNNLPFPMGNNDGADEGCTTPEETKLLVKNVDLWELFLKEISHDESGFKRDFIKLIDIFKSLSQPYPYLYSIAHGT